MSFESPPSLRDRQEPFQPIVCQLAEQKLQPSARSALQSVTHYVHAEQKQAQTAISVKISKISINLPPDFSDAPFRPHTH